jgi:hypothetical protein
MNDDPFEHEVRNSLRTGLGEGPAVDDAWDDVVGRLAPAVRRQQRRRLAVTVVVVLALVAALAWSRRAGDRDVRTGPISRGQGTSTTATTVAPATTVDPYLPKPPPIDEAMRTVTTTALPPGANASGQLIADATGAWYSDQTSAPESIIHVDPAGRAHTVSLPGVANSGVFLASGEGAIWALAWSNATLYRIDPASFRITAQIHVPKRDIGTEPEWVAAGGGSVWLTVCCDGTGPNQRLMRIDPTTLQVVGEADLPGDGESERVAVGPQGIFVTGEGFTTVAQLSADGSRVLRQIRVAGGAGPVTLGSQAYVIGGWQTGYSGGLGISTIDPASGTSRLVNSWPRLVQTLAAGTHEVWGVAAPHGLDDAELGPVYELHDGKILLVGNSDRVTEIAASGDTLWMLRGDTLVELHRP